MFETLPVEIQVYLFSLVFGVAGPALIYWMLRPALVHFLASIFHDVQIERFWLRLILLVLVLASLSVAVEYRPDSGVLNDSVALVFSLAFPVHGIMQNLLYALFALFLPLLATYTILHAMAEKGRPRG